MFASGTPGIIDQMPSHEEGEFELVLGNKQLLSVFFLVILLLGVFFSMGYIVGRNTAPATTLSASTRQPPIIVDSAGGRPIPLPPPDTTKPSAVPKVQPPPKVEPPPVHTAKVEPPKPVKPEPVKPVPVAKTEPPKPAPTVKGGGTFLQVVATRPSDAEKVVASLTQKGFPASISPVPDSSLVRVLVGPLADAAVITRTRSGLEAAGYKPMLRKF